jgi:hypothetical protein
MGALILAVAPWAVAPAQASIVYTINQTSTSPITKDELSPLSDTVMGTITTNGTMGAIQASDILDYNLQLIDNYRPALDFTLTPANSGIWYDTGNGLTATATALSFDFSIAGAVFIIQGTTPHGFSSGYNYVCFQATSGPCAAGETIVPDYFATDGVVVTGLSGPVSLGGPSPLALPEPASWAMMLVGFALTGYAMRKRMRTTVAYS